MAVIGLRVDNNVRFRRKENDELVSCIENANDRRSGEEIELT